MPYTPEHERKLAKAVKQMKKMGILATQKDSRFVFTNSAGQKVSPPTWLRIKQDSKAATVTALHTKVS
jgi:hypothetical protein